MMEEEEVLEAQRNCFISTQIQGQIEELEVHEKQQSESQRQIDGLKRFALTLEGEPPKKRPSATYKKQKTRKAKSITSHVTEKYSPDVQRMANQVSIIKLLSGNKKRVNEIVERVKKIEEKQYDTSQENSVNRIVYEPDEWRSILETIISRIPKLSKETLKTLAVIDRRYKKQYPAMWYYASTAPLGEELKMLHEELGSDDERDDIDTSFILSEDEIDPVVLTLSQVLEKSSPAQEIEEVSDSSPEATPLDFAPGSQFNPIEDFSSQEEEEEEDDLVVVPAINQLPSNLESPKKSRVYEIESSSPVYCTGRSQLPHKLVEFKGKLSSQYVAADTLGGNILGTKVVETFRQGKEDEIPASSDEEDQDISLVEILYDRVVPDTSIVQVPSSQQKGVEFADYTTAELRHKVGEWGLKPRKSRKSMIQLLSQTSQMVDHEILSQSQDTRSCVKESIFQKIKNVLMESQDWMHKISLFQPIKLEELQNFLQGEKIILDADTLQEFCDVSSITVVTDTFSNPPDPPSETSPC